MARGWSISIGKEDMRSITNTWGEKDLKQAIPPGIETGFGTTKPVGAPLPELSTCILEEYEEGLKS